MSVESGAVVAILAGLTLVLVTAYGLGLLAERLGFAPVVGELLTGLLLGPSLLGVLAPRVAGVILPVPAWLAALSSLGLVFLLVLAGTEVDPAALRRRLRPTVAVGAGATVVPFLLGFALGWLLPRSYLVAGSPRLPFALFLGTALSISAVPVVVRVLIDLDAMGRPIGQLTVTTALLIDVVGWLSLTVVASIARGGGVEPAALGWTLAVLALLLGVVLTLGPWVVGTLSRITDRTRSPALSGFSLVVGLGIGLAGLSSALGLEPVIGAFLAGVLVRGRVGAEASAGFQAATLGLFAPLFFATAGLRADLAGLLTPGTLAVAGVTLAVAVAGKVLGVAIGARFTDLTGAETRCLAVGLNARGAMEIVVAALGLALGILTPAIYTVIVLIAVVTSVMTPPLLRRSLAGLPAGPGETGG